MINANNAVWMDWFKHTDISKFDHVCTGML